VVGIGGYLGAIFHTPKSWEPGWWIVCYAIFVALNIFGVALSFRFSVFIALAALLVLIVLWIGAIPHVDFKRYAFDVPSKGWLPALPFALWLYLGIEQLPLAAEESHDPRRDMPKGILYGLLTLIACSFLTMILSAAIAPGAAKLGASQEPLVLSFQTIAGSQWTKLFATVACIGLIASFHTILYAYGRQIYSLSRAGYFPQWLSVTSSRHQTPVRALVSGSLLGLAAAFGIYVFGQNSQIGAILLNMAVFGAVIAYILQMASFLILRKKNLERPYVSPLGVAGAWIAMLISAITLIVLFMNPEYTKGVYGAAIWFALGIAYFAFYARKRLVLSPEEAFALKWN
jgi:ethanolamine permease